MVLYDHFLTTIILISVLGGIWLSIFLGKEAGVQRG